MRGVAHFDVFITLCGVLNCRVGESVERQLELPADDNPNFHFVEASFA